MATQPPSNTCPICGERLKYEAVKRPNPRRLMRPTKYQQLPHACVCLSVLEAFKSKTFGVTR